MTIEPDSSGADLYRETAAFLETCGARPAGSPAEAAALSWLQARMELLGYACQRQPFTFTPLSPRLLRNLLGSAVVIAAAALLPRFPYLALALPVWLALLPALQRDFQARLPGRLVSHNLLCLPGGDAGKVDPDRVGVDPDSVEVDLLLTAHVDTARALPYRSGWLLALRAQWFDILRRVGWITALTGGLSVLVDGLPPLIIGAVLLFAALSGLVLLAVDLSDAFGAGGAHTRGANDNASGVIVLLALARRLADLPGLQKRVGFLFSGAEEVGLVGARHAAQWLQPCAARLRVVSVDMVGAGERLNIYQGVSGLRSLRTDPRLNAALQRADPQAQGFFSHRRSGDFAPFAQAGFRASGIEASGSPQFWSAYHTLRDDLPLLQPERMARTVEVLARLVEQLDLD
ncbi:MAG: M20/M25/M40 family metallo-hydrolase [Chloroflexota bacterium]